MAGNEWGQPPAYFYPYKKGPNGASIPGLEEGKPGEYLTDRLTDEAEKFVEANKDRPFFLYFAHYAVHIPLQAKKDLIERYKAKAKPDDPQNNAIYAAMVESVDDSVGRLLKKLDDLKIADHTIVVFFSDNGGLSVKEGPDTPSTSNAPLRAGKGYLYEGGIREPMIVRLAGRRQAGRRVRRAGLQHRLLPDPAGDGGGADRPEADRGRRQPGAVAAGGRRAEARRAVLALPALQQPGRQAGRGGAAGRLQADRVLRGRQTGAV